VTEEVKMLNSKRIQSLKSLREEMVAVAKGKRPAPPNANVPSFDSLETVARLLTKENRKLLSLIRDSKPQSVAELAQLSGRSQPNLTRTLNKLEAVGFVVMKPTGRQKAPTVAIQKLTVEINPYSESDTLRLVPSASVG
jgi:predicted transcriptional regulator